MKKGGYITPQVSIQYGWDSPIKELKPDRKKDPFQLLNNIKRYLIAEADNAFGISGTIFSSLEMQLTRFSGLNWRQNFSAVHLAQK